MDRCDGWDVITFNEIKALSFEKKGQIEQLIKHCFNRIRKG